MEWDEIRKEKNFTEMHLIFEKYGEPKFKLKDLPIYYMGEGFLLAYSKKKFSMENGSRIEYGEEGEFLIAIYNFINKQDIGKIFFLNIDDYHFEGEIIGKSFPIMDSIDFNSNYSEVSIYFRKKEGYFNEGESRVLDKNRNFVFRNNWVTWGGYMFYFFGKTKKTKLGAFEYNIK